MLGAVENRPAMLIEVDASSTTATKDSTLTADTSLFLVELPPNLSADLNGANIVGSKDSTHAALVLPDSSYLLAKVESSNSFVLCPPPTGGNVEDDENTPADAAPLETTPSGGSKRARVSAHVCPSYHYELTRHYLDFSRLYQILSSSTYEGAAEEGEEKSKKRHTFEEVRRCVGFALFRSSSSSSLLSLFTLHSSASLHKARGLR